MCFYTISIHRRKFLKERMEKYKIYEDYLLKTLEYFPKSEFKTQVFALPHECIPVHLIP